MTQRRRSAAALVVALAFAGLPAGAPAFADPAEPAPVTTTEVAPPPPPPVSNNPMTPHQPPVPVDPAAAAPAPAPGEAAPGAPAPGAPVPAALAPSELPPVPRPSVPPVQNPNANGNGGILGSLIDLWHQARDPSLTPGDPMGPGGGIPAVPAGAGPAPALPPGYVSINAPGSETPSTSNGGAGPATGRPALPPGYYSTSAPPPPWYLDPTAQPPAS